MNLPNSSIVPKRNLKWLLIVFGIVILVAIAVYFFYVKGGNVSGVFSLSSPSPTGTVAISPGTSPTSTIGDNEQPSEQTNNQSTRKTYDGYISDADPSFRSDQYCVYKISFEYPNDYPDPSFVAGTLSVFKDQTSRVRIEPAGDKEKECNPGVFSNPTEYYNMWHHGEIIEGPTYSEANGNSIVIWSQKYDSGTPTHPELSTSYLKQAFLMNGTRYILISTSYTISHSSDWPGSQTTQFDSAFDTIVNSFKIK